MDNELLVKSIRELCKKNNVAVSQLESDLNFGAGLISRWVKSSPSLDKIVDIADYFHVSIDEVVGRKYVVDDDFIVALIEETEKANITWQKYNNNENAVKKYRGKYISKDQFINHEQYVDYLNNHADISYYTSFKNGYISIYSFYEKRNIAAPEQILLFIQPNVYSELVLQKYKTNELLPLWLKIIFKFKEDLSDEIKAEDLKNSFVLNNSKLNSKDGLSKKTDLSNIQDIMSSPEVLKLMEIYNQPEFKKMQETFNNPEVQAAIQIASKLQHYFNK